MVNAIGERLAKQAAQSGMLLMMCDMCSLERGLATGQPRWCDPDGTGRTEPGECQVTGTSTPRSPALPRTRSSASGALMGSEDASHHDAILVACVRR